MAKEKNKNDILSIQSEILKLTKRKLTQIAKMLKQFFHQEVKYLKNINGDTNKETRDIFLTNLVVFFTEQKLEIAELLSSKIKYKLSTLKIDFYKQDTNWTDIFIIVNFYFSKDEIVKVGIVITKVVKDFFVCLVEQKIQEEIIKDEKRPRRFHFYSKIDL